MLTAELWIPDALGVSVKVIGVDADFSRTSASVDSMERNERTSFSLLPLSSKQF